MYDQFMTGRVSTRGEAPKFRFNGLIISVVLSSPVKSSPTFVIIIIALLDDRRAFFYINIIEDIKISSSRCVEDEQKLYHNFELIACN